MGRKEIIRQGSADAATVNRRFVEVSELLVKLREELPKDAARIEVDVVYDDGGRVKLEARS